MTKSLMRPAHVVEIITPKKYVLNGLWFGPKRPKQLIVWVHGLGSNLFSKLAISNELVDAQTAVIGFNNRGHDKVSTVGTTTGKRIVAGAAHEKFTDSVDDIQGAINFARRQGVKNIFLAGHSTGCQKSVYWSSKKGRGVKGVILLAPVSDRAAEIHTQGKRNIEQQVARARSLVQSGKPNELMTSDHWLGRFDAQRYLSLYSGEGAEEIFTYWAPKKNARSLTSIKLPILVLLAENDEYADRPAKDIATWFEANIRAPHKVVVVSRVKHSFKGGEKTVAREIRRFIDR